MDSVKVAVVQTSPVILDRDATATKACDLIGEAAGQGAKLVLFPEAIIPAYPRGMSFGAVVGSRSDAGREAYAKYWDNSVEIPGPVTDQLGAAAKKAGSYVAVGVIERDNNYRGGTLYCTLLYIGPDGRILGKHRKLKPTASERLIWGEGDGSTLTAVKTEFGTIGGLICWENYMPLARMAMYQKGVNIYLAPTADNRDAWQSTIQHIALEGRCFVLSCNQFVTRDMMPPDWEDIGKDIGEDAKEGANEVKDQFCRGGSAIIGPMGQYLAGPLYGEEGILSAELELSLLAQARFDFDVVGHYQRPDVFKLIVNEAPL